MQMARRHRILFLLLLMSRVVIQILNLKQESSIVLIIRLNAVCHITQILTGFNSVRMVIIIKDSISPWAGMRRKTTAKPLEGIL